MATVASDASTGSRERARGGFIDLFARLRAHAAADPSRPALTFLAAHEQRLELTYGELVARAGAMARRLSRQFAAGDRALILLPAHADFAVSFLGCLAAGIIAVPLPVPENAATRRRVLGAALDCSPAALISTRSVHEAVAEGTPELRPLCDRPWVFADLLDGPGPALGRLPPVSAEGIAFLQYTSGSTAAARGVMVSHGSLMANEALIHDAFRVSAESTVVSWLPLHHDMGLIGGLLQPLYAGARAVIMDPRSFVRGPVTWLRVISEERADISGAPNFAYDLCLRTVTAAQKEGLDLSTWRVAFNGAAQVFPQTLRAFSDAFGDVGFRASSHVPCYGLAEATLLVAQGSGTEPTVTEFSAAALERGHGREASAGELGTRELVAYDLPTHATVRVVHSTTGEPVDEGRVGELVVAGPSNGSGHWADPAGSAATFGLVVDGDEAGPYLRTGDLGFVHRGRLYITGRTKDLIVHRGRNLHPQDIEADVAVSDPAARPGRCAVFSVPYDGDEAIVVCQEVRPNTARARYAEIADHIRAAVARGHDVTAHTVVLAGPGSLETTTSGKLQRYAVRRRFLDGALPPLYSSTLDAPILVSSSLTDRVLASVRTDASHAERVEAVTRALCDHLGEVLGLPDPPTRDASLASLGVDSLLAVRLQNEIEDALGVDLPPTLILRADSIREIADAVLAAPPRTRTPAADEAPVYDLTETQRALWFLQRAYPDSYAYNVTRAFRLTGDVDVPAVSSALAAVVARHPSLRLAVHSDDGEPRAMVASHGSVNVTQVDARAWRDGEEADWYRIFATTPFDLGRDPLLRAALVRRDDGWSLVLSLHHIICDLASLTIIVSDFARAYAVATGARPHDDLAVGGGTAGSPVREPAIVAAEADRLAEYWTSQLAGQLTTLSLPRVGAIADQARRGRGSGSTVPVAVPADLTAALTRYARASGLTLHSALLAAYQVLLHRLSGQADLLVGIPTMGRDDRRLESWVGYLINAVPVRSAYAPYVRFDEFAQRTQRSMLDALDHRDLALSTITRLVNPERLDAATPLFQAMFEYYTTALPGGQTAAAVVLGDPAARIPMGSCVLQGTAMPEHTAQSEVSLNVAVTDGAVTFGVQYSTERVSREQAEQLARTFTTMLRAIADDPRQPVGALPLSTPEEIDNLVKAGLGPQVTRPGHYIESFERIVDTRPDTPAVDDGVVRLTYAELDERANHFAARLRADGLGVDATVVLCAQRSADYLVGILGIHKADGCYVPISPTEAPRRAAAMIGSVRPVVCVADEAGNPLLSAALAQAGTGDQPPVRDLAELAGGRSAHRPAFRSPGQAAAFVIHTSGSTGTPKSVVVTNEGMTNHIWQMLEHFDIGPGDCLAQTAPVSFDISVWQFLAPLVVGARVRVVTEPASGSPAGLLRAVRDGGVSILELVPSMIVALLDAGLAASPGALRVMISTGDSLTHDVAERWRTELPEVPLYNAYGPAECSDDVTMGGCAYGPDAPISWSIGRPLANTSVLVLDDDFVPAPVGVTGTLCVGGIAVGRGYLGDPGQTAAVFVPDPWSDVPGSRRYVTGDLGRLTTDGDLEFLGRSDTQIKLRGIRIEAGEVEAALRAYPDVTAAVVKVEPGTSGAVLVGYVVFGGEEPGRGLRPEELRVLDAAEERALRAALQERLPRQLLPTIFVRTPRLPRSANGKLDYAALDHTRAAQQSPDGGDHLDDPLSATVRSIWAEVLERADVAWNDSFFRLGGHSLLALTMLDQVNRVLAVDLDVDTVFSHPRLRDFVEAVRRAERRTPDRPGARTAPADRAVDVPASAAQQRFWFLHELDPGQPTYNMPGVLRLRGELHEAALQGALREVLSRHPVLLARFSAREATLTWTAATPDESPAARVDLRGVLAELGEEAFDQYVANEATRPFDLRREHPFRAALVRLGAGDWALLVTLDHIACDGISLSLFLADLADSYNRLVRSGAPPRPAAHPTFADYCREEHAWLTGRDRASRESDAARWRGTVVEPVSLSPVSARAGTSGGAGVGRHVGWVAPELAGDIQRAAGRFGTTPFIVFATALSALIHSGAAERETVLVGTLITQRDRAAWRHVVGPFLNVSLLATRLAPDDAGADALRLTRESALRAYRSRHLPFQEVARLFRPASGGDGAPFDVMLVMQPTTTVPEFDGLAATLEEIEPDGAPYPLTVDIGLWKDGYRLAHRFASERYEHCDIEALATRLHDVTAMLVRNPERTVGEILRAAGNRGSR